MEVRSVHEILVKVPKTYEDTIKCGNIELYLDTRFNDVKHTIRYGEVVSSPDKRFATGDIIYFHHNIVRRIRTMSGKEKDAPSILDDIFHVPTSGVYAFKRNGVFKTIPPYCFIKPYPKIKRESPIEIIADETDGNQKGEERQWGIVKYGNEELEEQGVKEGDIIIFNKDSEYEYPIDGEKLYLMETGWIVAHVRI